MMKSTKNHIHPAVQSLDGTPAADLSGSQMSNSRTVPEQRVDEVGRSSAPHRAQNESPVERELDTAEPVNPRCATQHPREADFGDIRFHAAHHEAAHAVIAYRFGGKVNHKGVEIDDPYCGVTYNKNSELVHACVTLAGYLAEMLLWPDRVKPYSDDELQCLLTSIRERRNEDEESDNSGVFTRFVEEHPEDDDSALITRYREYQIVTLAVLRDPIVWQAVKDVAKALLAHGKLQASEVERLIPAQIRSVASHGDSVTADQFG